ncbi:MAG TPA: hypothetical protein VL460_06900 [Caulobacteraceae bacterium]|jgi:hypothetical protein|nr:hypothetical protein [Caulobacteraceae bacterium]
MIGRIIGSAILAAVAGAAPAWAQADILSRESFSGLVDLRLAAADGERSWTDEAYGKIRYGGPGAGDGLRITPQLAEAALVWKPRFTWALSGVVHVQHQPEQEREVDLVEAYLNWKPTPTTAWRYGARAGLFYPPISMEHDDPAWGVTHTITPSAINSWVGEEVKVVALEGKLGRSFDSGDEVSVTAAVFDYNDTSGTLLSLRGWALDDVQAGAFSGQALPALPPRYQGIWRGQAEDTYPVYRLDKRVGAYGRLDWRTSGPLTFNLFYYDNFGNRTAVRNLQWSWDTRFWNFGATLDVDKRTKLLAQALSGSTLEGYPTPRGIWIDVDFNSVYLLATRSYGKASVAGRVEYFETRDFTWQDRDDNNEHGWALTGAYRYELTPYATLRLEALHVASDRPARLYRATDPHQAQILVQSSLRLHF